MPDRLLLAALWPIMSILIGGAALACYALAEWHLSCRAAPRRDLLRATLRRLLYWAILVTYLVLPSVSRSIFKSPGSNNGQRREQEGVRVVRLTSPAHAPRAYHLPH